MLTPIAQEPLVDRVEREIYEYIKERKFQPGDSLPGEEDFATQLQISRPVVREALSRLRMIGLISSKKRRGIVLGRPQIFETLSKAIDPAFLDHETRMDFWRLRITIELGLADILVLNIEDKEIDELERIVGMEESDPANFTLYMRCDCEFHSLIYKATKCKALASFQKLLLRFFSDIKERKSYATSNFATRFSDPDKTTHRDILNAIKTKDGEAVHNAMRKHLSIYIGQGMTTLPKGIPSLKVTEGK
jgi:GntR family transcriptional regulator, transcriptional repressor for pyruvate dehydrogenase complex